MGSKPLNARTNDYIGKGQKRREHGELVDGAQQELPPRKRRVTVLFHKQSQLDNTWFVGKERSDRKKGKRGHLDAEKKIHGATSVNGERRQGPGLVTIGGLSAKKKWGAKNSDHRAEKKKQKTKNTPGREDEREIRVKRKKKKKWLQGSRKSIIGRRKRKKRIYPLNHGA